MAGGVGTATKRRCDISHYTTNFRGSGFIQELASRDEMTQSEAREWIEDKTKTPFVPDAMYKLRWPKHHESQTWSGYEELRVHVMSDCELATMERQVRKENNMPPRKSWEPWMFESAMGKVD